MKVSKWYNNEDIRTEEVPLPVPGRDEMLIKVFSCGICGSDIVEWYRLPRAPLVQGHEIGAEVVKVGEAVGKYKPGDRVFVAPKVPCMTCVYCSQGHFPVCSEAKERLPGGFSEYILVPSSLVENGTYLLPEHVTYDQSTFIEPLACVVRAQSLAGLVEGRTLLIMGCGMSGLLHAKLARSKNCRVIATDISAPRRVLAEKCGADVAIDSAEDVAQRLIDENGRKADVVMLCTSAVSAVEQAWQCVDRGGTIVFFAVPGPDEQILIPINDFWTHEVQIRTSYYCGPTDILEAIDCIESGAIEVDSLITHRLPLRDIGEGFRLVMAGTESMKVIIHPNG
jgi:L-iditol 2-dehydrogenase